MVRICLRTHFNKMITSSVHATAHTAHTAHAASHHAHLLHHHWVLLSCHHHKFHLLLLHVFRNLWVLIDFVMEQSCLEFIFSEAVIYLNPVMSDCADQHWHHHWVLAHLVQIRLFKFIKSKVVRCLYKFNCLFA